MRGADCFNSSHERIPQCLRSDIEVIDLSWNRIRKIVEDDLKRYKSLKILYLDENMIMNVDENAFTSMTSLEILDMSWNSYNQNTNILEDIERLKPITSPLQYLELAFDDLNELPDLGVLPTLFYFNITGNANVKFNSSKFAGICNLKALNNNDTTASFDDPCECWSLEKWLEGRGVEFQSFSCKAKIDSCNRPIAQTDIQIYEDCIKNYEELVMKARMLTIVLPICVLVIVISYLFCITYTLNQKKKCSCTM
ncbi:Leucine rich repeat [Popillia japonica]|uniref:Leucine rich repeat n=1 Tax=Popillia japonica TaxID=7064 RepID=A0AAW1J0F7_POPJA